MSNRSVPPFRSCLLSHSFLFASFHSHAGLKILESLTARAGDGYLGSQEKQLILESLLPQKETIVTLARKMLADSEAAVTALSSGILAGISWWP